MKPRKLKTPNGRAVKARGRNWENDVAALLQSIGMLEAKRNGSVYGSKDRGDIGGVPLAVQCKAVDRILFWPNLDDAIGQAEELGVGDRAVVVYKRHGRPDSESAWVMPGSFALELLRAYYGGTDE